MTDSSLFTAKGQLSLFKKIVGVYFDLICIFPWLLSNIENGDR